MPPTEYTEDELDRAEQQLRDELTDRGWDPDDPDSPTIDDLDIRDRAELNREPDPDDYHDRRVDREIDRDFYRENPHYDD